MNEEFYEQYHKKGGDMIMPIEVFNDLYEDCKVYEKQNINKDKWLEFIADLGYDYDGYNDSDNLKQLIDELVHYARLAKNNIDYIEYMERNKEI